MMKQSKSAPLGKRVAVFGGSGFLGSHVADMLTERGFNVLVFDKRPSSFLKPGQQMIAGDITDADAVSKAIRGCQIVYHYAGFADLEDATTQPSETVRQNILGTAILLEAALKAGVQRFIYSSTIYVYSQLGGFYRCSKQAAENYVEEFQRRYGLDYTVLRYGTLYGPRADEHNSVWRYLHQALIEGKIAFRGTGEEIREYIHVKDAARLSVDILAKDYINQHVIVTGHHPMKARDMLSMVREIMNNKIKIEYIGPSKTGIHYQSTPYSFTPKIGNKLVSNLYLDMGQGLLECIEQLHQSLPRTKSSKNPRTPFAG
jgi:UDP-glucose 4-epimerase